MTALETIRAFVADAHGDEQGRTAALEALDKLAADWHVVPKVATDAMEQAAFLEAGAPSDWYGFADMWAAALAVAPKP